MASVCVQAGQVFRESVALRDPTDAAASGFYCANPNNAFVDNAASGGWAGFSFPVRTGRVATARSPLAPRCVATRRASYAVTHTRLIQ